MIWMRISLAEIHSAIAYYLHNKERVDKYPAKRTAAFKERRSEDHARSGTRISDAEIVL